MKLFHSAVAFLLTAGTSSAFTLSPSSFGVSPFRLSTDLFATRKPFITGNWKLNPQTREEAIQLAKEISDAVGPQTGDIDVALFVPYVFIEATMQVAGDKVMIGAEVSCHVSAKLTIISHYFCLCTSKLTHMLFPNSVQGVCPELKGAFTGAVSASMLESIGVKWVLAGHSERRSIFGETDEYINGQCLKLIEQGMSVMLCVGETESEYEQNLAGAVCAVQLKKGLAGIKKEDMNRVAIAYEPVWAIGTGKVATPEVAQKVHATCRQILAEMYDQETADSTRILYGGSVSPESVDELMVQPDIDGALVGGASLSGSKFSRIINFQPVLA